MNELVPPHIKREWLPLIQRIQGTACRQNGLAIISITVLVNEAGIPLQWTEPDMTRLEPLSRQADLISLLAKLPAIANAGD